MVPSFSFGMMRVIGTINVKLWRNCRKPTSTSIFLTTTSWWIRYFLVDLWHNKNWQFLTIFKLEQNFSSFPIGPNFWRRRTLELFYGGCCTNKCCRLQKMTTTPLPLNKMVKGLKRISLAIICLLFIFATFLIFLQYQN